MNVFWAFQDLIVLSDNFGLPSDYIDSVCIDFAGYGLKFLISCQIFSSMGQMQFAILLYCFVE